MSTYKGMHNPAHPGEVLKAMVLDPLGLTITQAAAVLKVSRKTLSEIVNGHSPVTPGMAMRIELAFASRAGLWIDMQAKRDAWEVESYRRELARAVKPYQVEGLVVVPARPAGVSRPKPMARVAKVRAAAKPKPKPPAKPARRRPVTAHA